MNKLLITYFYVNTSKHRTLVHFVYIVSYSKNAIDVKKASKKRPFCSYRQ